MDTLSWDNVTYREDRDQEIADMYNKGMSTREIANVLGWNPNKVSRRIRSCRKYGQIEGHAPQYLKEQHNTEIEILLKANTPEKDIAEFLGLSLEETRRRITNVKANIRRRERRECAMQHRGRML